MSNALILRLAGMAGLVCGLSCEYSPALKNGAKALQQISLLRGAEVTYHAAHRRYAGLTALGPTGDKLISPQLASGTEDGYRFNIEVSEDGYRLTASPLSPGKTGFAWYFCDESGIVRRSWGPGGAVASSPPVD